MLDIKDIFMILKNETPINYKFNNLEIYYKILQKNGFRKFSNDFQMINNPNIQNCYFYNDFNSNRFLSRIINITTKRGILDISFINSFPLIINPIENKIEEKIWGYNYEK